MVYSCVGYCKCGHEIWIEYLWNGANWKPRFSDDGHGELEYCPQCGVRLNEDGLESK